MAVTPVTNPTRAPEAIETQTNETELTSTTDPAVQNVTDEAEENRSIFKLSPLAKVSFTIAGIALAAVIGWGLWTIVKKVKKQ